MSIKESKDLQFTIIGLVFLLITGFFSIGCSSSEHSESQESIVPPEHTESQESMIPEDVNFSILKTETIPNIKRSLDVRLNKRVSEDVLRAIALKIKNQDSRAYEKTFITYYLPGMIVDSGAWATTHFNPILEVRILGLSVAEEAKLTAVPNQDDRQIIGIWIDDRIGMGERITIYSKNGLLYYEQAFKDGSNLVKEVIEKKSPLGRRFEKKEGSSAGDYRIIDSDGNLQFGDRDGVYATAKKIR